MDKFFTPSRYFVGFCALLIVAIFALNFVRDQKLLEEARVIGRQEAEWNWPSMGISTTIDGVEAKILKRSENDAEVEVWGEQKISKHSPVPDIPSKTPPVAGPESISSSDFKSVITLYKHGNSHVWWIGKVEGR